jgi:hypothetical protein
MAKKNRLTKVATSIGAAVGRADRTAHKMAKAAGKGDGASASRAEVTRAWSCGVT